MTVLQPSESMRAFGRLRRLVKQPRDVERCNLCGHEIAQEHDHLLEPLQRRLSCVCGACAVLFTGNADTRFRRVPDRVRALAAFQMTDAQWDALRLPINLAFFFQSTPAERVVAAYPSPAGATESLLSLDAWTDIVASNPILQEMQPDVEALLVNRVEYARGTAPAEYFLVPADQCYRLVGIIRSFWTGLSGGGAVWGEITRFTDELRRRASPSREVSDA